MRAAGYVRISKDRENEVSTKVQAERITALCQAKGWDLVEIYEDVGVSAYDPKVVRKDYERLLDAIRARAIDAVVVYKLDRITRSLRSFVDLMDVLEPRDSRHKAAFASVNDPIDTTTPVGRAILTVLVAFAQLESEQISLRTKGAFAHHAKAGRAHKGGPRPFGYARDGSIIEAEAAVVREMAARYLEGESLRGLAVELNERGVKTSGAREQREGRGWTPTTLGRTLRSPTTGGIRRHHENEVQGDWTPILDADTYSRILAASRQGAARRKSLARHLLTGILRCGECGAGMISKQHERGKNRYACQPGPGLPGCGGISISATVEESVRDMILAALGEGRLTDSCADPSEGNGWRADVERALREDRAAAKELSRDYYEDRLISRDEFLPGRIALAERIRQHEQQLARPRKGVALPPGAPHTPEALKDWFDSEDTPVEDKRAVVEFWLRAVLVRRAAVRGLNKIDLERLDPQWRR